MFNSILSTSVGTLSVSSALICITVALVLGGLIAVTYMFSGKYTKSYAISLVLLPALVELVIMMVNGNLGTGVAVLGAFSLVRYRSIPGSSKEICSIFFAMAIGLAIGTGYITYAIVATVIICIVFLLLSKTKFAYENEEGKDLRVTIPENLNYTDVFEDIFEKYTNKVTLCKVKTTNLGSMFELQYDVSLKDLKKEKDFIDEIRCRNGNLPVICSIKVSQREEL